jgi:hypothetical protein
MEPAGNAVSRPSVASFVWVRQSLLDLREGCVPGAFEEGSVHAGGHEIRGRSGDADGWGRHTRDPAALGGQVNGPADGPRVEVVRGETQRSRPQNACGLEGRQPGRIEAQVLSVRDLRLWQKAERPRPLDPWFQRDRLPCPGAGGVPMRDVDRHRARCAAADGEHRRIEKEPPGRHRPRCARLVRHRRRAREIEGKAHAVLRVEARLRKEQDGTFHGRRRIDAERSPRTCAQVAVRGERRIDVAGDGEEARQQADGGFQSLQELVREPLDQIFGRRDEPAVNQREGDEVGRE